MDLRVKVIGIVALISVVVNGGLSIYSIKTTVNFIRLERDYYDLLHERNLIDQNYDRMRREYEEKEEIYRVQAEKLKQLEEAETLDDYIRIWQEVDK